MPNLKLCTNNPPISYCLAVKGGVEGRRVLSVFGIYKFLYQLMQVEWLEVGSKWQAVWTLRIANDQ